MLSIICISLTVPVIPRRKTVDQKIRTISSRNLGLVYAFNDIIPALEFTSKIIINYQKTPYSLHFLFNSISLSIGLVSIIFILEVTSIS